MTGPRGPARQRRLHEAAHKQDSIARDGDTGSAARHGARRSINEAAHKLGYWAPPDVSAHDEESEATRRRFEALADSQRDVIAHAGRAVLVLGALGVVYGDIGTSPLYTEQVIFSSYKATAHITPATVYGIASLIFWALTVVVSIKYAGFIMRAHNRGDGGIMALTALLQRNRVPHGALLVTLGIFGAALFFGDGVITPAISVLGSIQGVQVATPALAHLIVPLSVAILLVAVRAAAVRVGNDRMAVRPGDPRLVHRNRHSRPQRGPQGPGGPPGAVPDLGGAVHDRPRRRRLSRARRRGAGRDRRRGPVRRPGPFRREPDPPGLVRRRVPGA